MSSLPPPPTGISSNLASTGPLFHHWIIPAAIPEFSNSIDFSKHDYRRFSQESYRGLHLVTTEDSRIQRPNEFCSSQDGGPRFKIVQVGNCISFRFSFTGGKQKETEFAFVYKDSDGTNWIGRRAGGGGGSMTRASSLIHPANNYNKYEPIFPHFNVLI